MLYVVETYLSAKIEEGLVTNYWEYWSLYQRRRRENCKGLLQGEWLEKTRETLERIEKDIVRSPEDLELHRIRTEIIQELHSDEWIWN